MAITIDSLVEVSLIQQTFAGQVYNVFGYEVTSGIGEVEGVSVGEAWWNYVKDEYRAMVRPTEAWLFSSVVVREMNNPTGVLAEWSIPTGEQQGSRTGVGTSEFLPPFNAAGFKMTVGSRATRPGQKRIGGLLEVDAVAWSLDATYKALLVTLAEELCTTLTLAAPAATWNLTPNIFRKDATGAVTAHQAVTGYVINNNVTSQVSRKLGLGA